ncbi:MAG: bacillithiol biosynthesis BshC [Chloroflexi bacterium]|nr:bacillithiol biosynthesis BshC [Chloroflexota bacterium]
MTKINLNALPVMAEEKLYLDYLAGSGAAAKFFTHPPLGFSAALESRRTCTYPRRKLSQLLSEYNAKLGAHAHAMSNIDALSKPSTFCVIGGQQAGFLGGPVYTCYKIITTIRLAQHLQNTLGERFVPVFWLASEDHDFDEINHAHFIKSDGEVGDVKFEWDQAGRPIALMPITADIRRAFAEYFEKISPGPYLSQIKERFAPQAGDDYCTWQARIWSELFSDHGLVIVEPRTLRPAASGFFQFALNHVDEISHRLDAVAEQLDTAGYIPALNPERAGQLYTFDSNGYRVRVDEPRIRPLEDCVYSTDVALRPLFADTVLPTVASVLGPGEISYHAMLKPLYDLFDLPQPLFYPRKSYTILTGSEAKRIAEYKTSPTAILIKTLDTDAVFRRLIPESESTDIFTTARRKLEEAFAPLRPYVEEIDPNLGKAWQHGLSNTMRGLDNLEQGTIKARMSHLGFSRGELRQLSNILLPKDRLQERVFPLPYFMQRHGMKFLDSIFSAGEIEDFSHHILVMEADND